MTPNKELDYRYIKSYSLFKIHTTSLAECIEINELLDEATSRCITDADEIRHRWSLVPDLCNETYRVYLTLKKTYSWQLELPL